MRHLSPYDFIICLDYMLRMSIDKMKNNGFRWAKKRFPTQTIMDADYTNDIGLLANTPAQFETLLRSLEQATASIGLHVNRQDRIHML